MLTPIQTSVANTTIRYPSSSSMAARRSNIAWTNRSSCESWQADRQRLPSGFSSCEEANHIDSAPQPEVLWAIVVTPSSMTPRVFQRSSHGGNCNADQEITHLDSCSDSGSGRPGLRLYRASLASTEFSSPSRKIHKSSSL